jgi:hypothetical protein
LNDPSKSCARGLRQTLRGCGARHRIDKTLEIKPKTRCLQSCIGARNARKRFQRLTERASVRDARGTPHPEFVANLTINGLQNFAKFVG